MSDIQSKIAARRAELAQEEKAQKTRRVAVESRRQVARQKQEQAALDSIANDLLAGGIAIERDGEELALVDAPLPLIDIEGLKRSKVEALLKREARKHWTPGENWLVVGCIVGGICLIHLGGLGFVPLLFGLWQRSAINKKYRNAILSANPGLFAEV